MSHSDSEENDTIDRGKESAGEPENIPPRAAELGNGIKVLAWIVAVFLQFFPAASYFVEYAPPFFPAMGVFVSVLGIAILIWSFNREASASDLPSRVFRFVIAAIVLVIVYVVVLPYLTVMPPEGREESRRQIGFYMSCLTSEATTKIDELANNDPPIEVTTPNDLMMAFGVWGGETRIDEIWALWSVLLAGFILIVLFLFGFCFWAYGLGTLLRHLNNS